MTVSTTNAITGPLNGNGITTIFPFTFTAPSKAEVQVVLRDTATGEDTVVDPGLYTVALTIGGGGSVTFDTAPATGEQVFLKLNPLFTQDITFTDGVKITATALEKIADRAAARDQFLNEEVGRAVKVPVGAAPLDAPDIAGLVQIVVAMSGPLYTSIEEGLDPETGVAEGTEFPVNNYDGTASIYLNDAGSAVLQRIIVIDPSAPSCASLIGTTDGTLQEVLDDFRARLVALEP